MHPYPLQQIDELTYLFVTDSGDEYKCYFISYGNYFADYPDIVSKIFGFNVEVVNPPNRNYGNDVRLAYTVIKIVASFLQSKINAGGILLHTALLLHCDNPLKDRFIAAYREITSGTKE